MGERETRTQEALVAALRARPSNRLSLSSMMETRIEHRAVTDHGVQNGEELAHAGDKSDLLRLAGIHQPLVEGSGSPGCNASP